MMSGLLFFGCRGHLERVKAICRFNRKSLGDHCFIERATRKP